MSDLQNIRNININNVNVRAIAPTYNPNMSNYKTETLATVKAAEEAFEQKQVACEFDLNKQHDINVTYDFLEATTTKTNIVKDVVYGIEFSVNGNEFKYTADCLNNVTTPKVFMSSEILHNGESKKVNNTNDNEYVDWEVVSYRCLNYDGDFEIGQNRIVKFLLPFQDKTVYKIPAGFFKTVVPGFGEIDVIQNNYVGGDEYSGWFFGNPKNSLLGNLYKDVNHTIRITYGDSDYFREPLFKPRTDLTNIDYYVLRDDKDVFYYRDSTEETGRTYASPSCFIFGNLEILGNFSNYVGENFIVPNKTHKLYRHVKDTSVKEQRPYKFIDNTTTNNDMKSRLYLPTDTTYNYKMTMGEVRDTADGITRPMRYRITNSKVDYTDPEIFAVFVFPSSPKNYFGFKGSDGSITPIDLKYCVNYTTFTPQEKEDQRFIDEDGNYVDGYFVTYDIVTYPELNTGVMYYMPDASRESIKCAGNTWPYNIRTTDHIQNYLKYSVEYKTQNMFNIVVPEVIKELSISYSVRNLKFTENSRTSYFKLDYPNINLAHGFVNAAHADVYVSRACDVVGLTDMYTQVNLTCHDLHLSSAFFKDVELETAAVGMFGDFSTATISKIYVEQEGLNTSLTTTLISRIQELLNTTVVMELE